MVNTERFKPFIRGSVRVDFLHPDESFDRSIDLGSNVVAFDWTLLLAAMVKDVNSPRITHLAVGTGNPPYDISEPPILTTQKKLVAELFRKQIRTTSFVDSEGLPTLTATNQVDLIFRFEVGEAVGNLKEMGMFGGFGAEARNSGTIVNYKAFIPFQKPSNRIMVITWRLLFDF